MTDEELQAKLQVTVDRQREERADEGVEKYGPDLASELAIVTSDRNGLMQVNARLRGECDGLRERLARVLQLAIGCGVGEWCECDHCQEAAEIRTAGAERDGPEAAGLNPAPLEILRRALESISSIDCHCGIAGPCGCGDEAKSTAEDALQDVYGCPRCFGCGDIDDSPPQHARFTCPVCKGYGLLAVPRDTK